MILSNDSCLNNKVCHCDLVSLLKTFTKSSYKYIGQMFQPKDPDQRVSCSTFGISFGHLGDRKICSCFMVAIHLGSIIKPL